MFNGEVILKVEANPTEVRHIRSDVTGVGGANVKSTAVSPIDALSDSVVLPNGLVSLSSRLIAQSGDRGMI